jgi:hypothetical protein
MNNEKSALETASQVNQPLIACETFGDTSAYCVYRHSLVFSRAHGFRILTLNKSLHGTPVMSLDQLNVPPFHTPWSSKDFDSEGAPFLRPSVLPFRSFIKEPVQFYYGTVDNCTSIPGISAVLSFDADNYNIYHWCNKAFVAFLARLWHIEEVGRNNTNINQSLHRLYTGRGYDAVFALRPYPTDWQKNYADIALGVSNLTKYRYLPDIPLNSTFCFEHAIIPGASLYLGNGIANAQLFREMTERLKGVPIRSGWSPKNFSVTWFVRDDKRRVTNMDEATEFTRSIISNYSARFNASIKLDIVHWTGDTPFLQQASQMGRSRVLITTHGSALNHCMFMDVGGAVIEIDAYQFRYPLDDLIVLQQGHYFFRHSVPLADTQHDGQSFGEDPFPAMTGGKCNSNFDCIIQRRDANVRLSASEWQVTVSAALDAVLT